MEITWLGHAAFLIEGNDRVAVDPFLTGNPAASISSEKVSCDIVCVTHGHSDHVGDTIEIAKRNNAKVLAIVELANYLEKAGCDTVGFNIGGSVVVHKTKVSMTLAIHSSGAEAPGLEGAAGAPAGFVIDSGRTVFIAGDTALFGDMRLIGELFSIDVAILPIGGFYTMDIIQAAKAVELLAPKMVIPMHYNTWPPIEADPELFKSEVANISSAEVEILKPGESISL